MEEVNLVNSEENEQAWNNLKNPDFSCFSLWFFVPLYLLHPDPQYHLVSCIFLKLHPLEGESPAHGVFLAH